MAREIDKLLFTAASGFGGADEQRAFLEFACRDDPAMLRRLEELLEIQRDADEFFEIQPEMPHAADEQPPEEDDGGVGARIGPYRLIDRLGAGGCGVVYLAEQQSPVKRKVALKIIRLGMDTENVIARFAIEREALALMDHPNIARVLDAGSTAAGRPYFVMELVNGEKITDFCDHHRLDLRRRLELFILVCGAIQHAHQKGVIHRDIKPSNVLVRGIEGRLEPKVIDFGIAKATAGGIAAAATATQTGQLVGTPAYMSPEQAEGGTDIDTRSDIYSLGCLLCELITGSPPFGYERFTDCTPEGVRHLLRDVETGMPSSRLRAIPQDKIREIAACRGADPQGLVPQVAGDLDWIVMKAIEKDRQLRYETAEGLAADVRRHLSEQPVLARPPSRVYLFRKLVRRNRVVFAAGGVALFGLLGGFGVSTWLFFKERDAREEQARLRDVAERARANEVVLRELAESADLVAQAAVHIKYNEPEQADALVAGLPVEHAPRTLEAASTFKALADWNLLQHRWQQAATYFHLLIHVLTSVDMSDSRSVSYELMTALTAVRQWGPPGQYESDRSLAIRRFAKSADSNVAEQVIKATLMVPVSRDELGMLLPLSGVLERALTGVGRKPDPHMEAWRQFSLALFAFRREHYDAASALASQSLATAKNSQPRAASNRIVLAMVDLKQGRLTDARRALAGVQKSVEKWESAPFSLRAEDGGLWSNWGIVRILLKDAESMLPEAGQK